VAESPNALSALVAQRCAFAREAAGTSRA